MHSMMIHVPLAVLVAPILCQTDTPDEAVESLSLLQAHSNKLHSTDDKKSSLNKGLPPGRTAWDEGEWFNANYAHAEMKIGVDCKDKNGDEAAYGHLAADFTCLAQWTTDGVAKFNAELAEAGGCVAAQMTDKKWKTDPKTDWSSWKGTALDAMEICRKTAEVSEECAGANYYAYKGRCECGLGWGPTSIGHPSNSGIKYGFEHCDGIRCGEGQWRQMLCALKSLSLDDLGAGPWQPPFVPSHYKGIKSTYKVQNKPTDKVPGCSKGWWLILEKTDGTRISWLNEKTTHSGQLSETAATSSPGVMDAGHTTMPGGPRGHVPNRLPSACASAVDALSKQDKPWNNAVDAQRCIGARGAIMRGGTQDYCGCWFGNGEFEGYKKYPEDGVGMRYSNNNIWVCGFDGGDYTGGDDAYPIPFASGIYNPDGPQGPMKKVKKTPEEKAQCKAARGARKDAKKALKDAKAAWAEAKKARDALRLAKAAFKASKEKEASDC